MGWANIEVRSNIEKCISSGISVRHPAPYGRVNHLVALYFAFVSYHILRLSGLLDSGRSVLAMLALGWAHFKVSLDL